MKSIRKGEIAAKMSELVKKSKKYAENEQKKYKISELIFKGKSPTKKDIQKFRLTPIRTDSNPVEYEYDDISIINYFQGIHSDIFKLTINEILSFVKYYGVKIDTIRINNYEQPNIQGVASRSSLDVDDVSLTLTLFIPNDWCIKNFKAEDVFEGSICLLLHEISHLLGNIASKGCEPEADRFALQEYKKWLKIL